MTVRQARQTARQWMLEETRSIPGFRGAYIAGSTNWLPDDGDLPTASDVDIMVLLADPSLAGRREKFIYHDVLLEISNLGNDRLQSPDEVLGDYHLAPSFRTTKFLFDPFGHLTPLLAVVSRDYTRRDWVRQRCKHARDKVLRYLRSINQEQALHDQVMACLFAAGITTHVLLVAGLKNPTVRARYVDVRHLLAEYGHVGFHEALLELLGSHRISPERAALHVTKLAEIFDVASRAMSTSLPFASDISNLTRCTSVDASLALIERGYHRQAMFWIVITHSRCIKILSYDAPSKLTQGFNHGYQELLADLGIPTVAEIRNRCGQIEGILPRIGDLAESIIAANDEIVESLA